MNKIQFCKTKFIDSLDYFWDIQIDGSSIRIILDSEDVTPIGWGSKSESLKAMNRLRLRDKSILKSKQIELLVCSCCGDIGCGSITISIKELNGNIIWNNFTYENEVDTDTRSPEDEIEVGPFKFDKKQYFNAFNSIKL